jgi:hypothetical protein
MYARLGDGHTLFYVRDGLQALVFNFDEVHSVESRVFVQGCDRRHGVAYEANAVYAERVLVLADGQNAVRDRQIFACDNGMNAGKRRRFRHVNVFNDGVRLVASQHLAMKHARQDYVVCKLRLARALLSRVNFTKGLADYFERLNVLAVRLVAVSVLTHNRR